MSTYTACEHHHSISRAVVHYLTATNEASAKREARKLLGDGFRGHSIYLEQLRADGARLPVAVATIGIPGWQAL